MMKPGINKTPVIATALFAIFSNFALAAEPQAPAKEEKSGSAKYYGAATAATAAATAYATKEERLFRNSAEPQPLSSEQIKVIKDEVEKSRRAGNDSKSLISGKRPVVVISLADKLPEDLSLIERIRMKIFGAKEVRTIDPLRDAKAEELKHFEEQLEAFRNNGKNVGEVGVNTARKALINSWAKRGFWLGAGSGAGFTLSDLYSLSQKLDPTEYMGREISHSSLRKAPSEIPAENPNNAAAAIRSGQGVEQAPAR